MDQQTKLAVLAELDRMALGPEAHLPLGESVTLARARVRVNREKGAGRTKLQLTAELLVVEDADGNFPHLVIHTDDGETVQIVSYDVREVH